MLRRVEGAVSLRSVSGKGLVSALLTGRDPSPSASATAALDWSTYKSAVVQNAVLASGTEQLTAYGDSEDTATTADDLGQMNLVQVLAAILHLEPRTRTKSAAQRQAEATATAVQATAGAARVVTDRRRHTVLVSTASGEGRALHMGATSSSGTTECLRYGFTFMLASGDTESYSLPIDEAVERHRSGLAFAPRTALGVDPNPVPSDDAYGKGLDLEAWEVTDVGAGVLGECASLTARTSFAAAVRVDLDPAQGTANGVALGSTAVWRLLDSVVYRVVLASAGTCQLRCDSAAVSASIELGAAAAADRDLVIRVAFEGGAYRYLIAPPEASAKATTYSTSTDADTVLTVVGGPTIALRWANNGVPGSGALRASAPGDTFAQVQARGLRASLRTNARSAAAAAASTLPATDDLAGVAHVLQYLEWPAAGSAALGFGAARALAPVAAATTAPLQPLQLAEGTTVDGVRLSAGQRVLVKDQADPRENGVYDVAPFGRAADLAHGAQLEVGTQYVVAVAEGATHKGREFAVAVDAAASVVVVGTHGLPVRPHRPRWPVARQVLGGSERSTDRSQELLRTVCDGYHRYTFGSARALVVGGAGHTTVAGPNSDRVYLANASYRLLLGVPAAVVVAANTPETAVVTATSTTHA